LVACLPSIDIDFDIKMEGGCLTEGKCVPSLRLSEVAALLGGELVDDRDPLISGVAAIDEAGPGDLTFVASRKFAAKLVDCRAAAALIGPEDEAPMPAIRVAAPYPAFARFLQEFKAADDRVFPPGIHPTAVIDEQASLGGDVAIGPYCVVGPGVEIGNGTRLCAHVVIGPDVAIGRDCRFYARACLREGCQVGDRVILHVGATLGTDGFGYLPSAQGLQKIPQVGIVVLEDDVEIGSGVCIDRATMGRTVIGAGSKIDNLVQVGHNVRMGSHCAISAQTGISGSANLGDRVTMGGQVGVSHGAKIGSQVMIGGQSGVTRDLAGGAEYFGLPAVEARESFRIIGSLRKLPELLRRVARLESEMSDSKKEQE
jgi:UDP-3-O-[3-hydroxymyristoyl] glucosamine N-acyltransferase